MSDKPMKTPAKKLRFVNLQSTAVHVYDAERKRVIVHPFDNRDRYPHEEGLVFVVEGAHYQQFCSAQGPLYPFPESSARLGGKAGLSRLPDLSPRAGATDATLMPLRSRQAQIEARNNLEAREGEEGEGEAGGEGQGEGGSEAPSDNAAGTGEGEGAGTDAGTPGDGEAPASEPEGGDEGQKEADVNAEAGDAEADAAGDAEAEAPVAADKLSAVKNVGPATETALNENGIETYAQLAEADPEVLAAIPAVTGSEVDQIKADAAVFAQGKNPYKRGLKDRAK